MRNRVAEEITINMTEDILDKMAFIEVTIEGFHYDPETIDEGSLDTLAEIEELIKKVNRLTREIA